MAKPAVSSRNSTNPAGTAAPAAATWRDVVEVGFRAGDAASSRPATNHTAVPRRPAVRAVAPTVNSLRAISAPHRAAAPASPDINGRARRRPRSHRAGAPSIYVE